MSKKIFVACPYNSKDEFIKETRVNILTRYCVDLFNSGDSPISALLMGLTLAHNSGLPTDTITWKIYSETLLKGCDELHVLMVPDWKESTGIQTEINKALELGIPIRLIDLLNEKNVFEKLVDDLYNEMNGGFSHHGTGTSIRNELKLWWQPDWDEPKPEIVSFFNDLNIYHADDMSGSLNEALQCKQVGLRFDLMIHIQTYFKHWKEYGFENGIYKNK